jgi:MinD superfamily P-loop ATPase
MKTTEKTFRALDREHCGYCPDCKTITAFGGIEPDADGYHCDDCNGNRLMGAANALIMGKIRIVEPNEDDNTIWRF